MGSLLVPAKAPAVILAPTRYDLKQDDVNGHVKRELRKFPMEVPTGETWRQKFLGFLRDNVHSGIPGAYYQLVLGHPLHISQWGALKAKVFRPNERDPFHPLKWGWMENLGVIGLNKVTTAFRDFEAGALVTDVTSYGDYKYHEVGTSGTAEANTQTALITPSGISRVTGTQTNPLAYTYQSIGTITADATETWQEHGLFNASSGVTLMDRTLFTGIAVVSSDEVEFTYVLTKNAEA